MKTFKRLLRPDRLRVVPVQFSWIDQALVRCTLIDRLDARTAALYLFLVTVADAEGLSYYGNETLAKRLHLSAAELVAARAQLVELDLLAYQAPLYQVLSLGSAPRVLSGNAGNAGARASGGGLVSLAEIIERASRHA